MSDIDIERLREALMALDDLKFGPPSMDGYQSYHGRFGPEKRTALYEVEKLIKGLLSLADEGGELWAEKPHPNGRRGFRVRVWPKADA